jgi:hypothetical protein
MLHDRFMLMRSGAELKSGSPKKTCTIGLENDVQKGPKVKRSLSSPALPARLNILKVH